MTSFAFEKCTLGIELGSTRIKAVLIDGSFQPVAKGEYIWQSRLSGGIWTYSLDEVWKGIQSAYGMLAESVRESVGAYPTAVGAIGVSAMMHGYLPFDSEGKQLCDFRTWQNTITEDAARELSAEFQCNIPQRWSVAHLYHAILCREAHVSKISSITTLSGYVHRALTGENVLGLGDASGMFPLRGNGWDASLLDAFDALPPVTEGHFAWRLRDILPQPLAAGESAGFLTPGGAALLDPNGALRPGIPFCPPEGDAGTGMVATNAVRPGTGNVSAGTSLFSMVVLKDPPEKPHREIDIVSTPDGYPVAMNHCNNCTGELNAWVALFRETAAFFGAPPSADELFNALFRKSLEGDADAGGLTAFNLLAGEPVVAVTDGMAILLRRSESRLTLPNLLRCQFYSMLAVLRIGMDILRSDGVSIDSLVGHGGMFKTPGVFSAYLASALDCPVSVMTTAGEGGPYGMALLAQYGLFRSEGNTLAEFLESRVFGDVRPEVSTPDEEIGRGFARFMERYSAALAVERHAASMPF